MLRHSDTPFARHQTATTTHRHYAACDRLRSSEKTLQVLYAHLPGFCHRDVKLRVQGPHKHPRGFLNDEQKIRYSDAAWERPFERRIEVERNERAERPSTFPKIDWTPDQRLYVPDNVPRPGISNDPACPTPVTPALDWR